MADLIFTGNNTGCSYSSTPFIKGLTWLREQEIIGFDTETNYVDSVLERDLKVLSMANEDGSYVWVVDFESLSLLNQQRLFDELKKKLCIIHSVAFDYSILARYGTKLEKVYDTYLNEMIPKTGLSSESGVNGLQAVYKRRFDLDISKSEQLTFGDGEPYTDDQIRYAAIDVIKLGVLRKIQIGEMKAEDKRLALVVNNLKNKGLRKTSWWENEVVKGISDIETNGLRLHKEKWYAIEDEIIPIRDEELLRLNEIAKESYWDTLVANNWVSDKDEIITNVWTSSAKKKLVLSELYNFEVEKTAKTELKKYLQEHDPNFPEGLKLSGKAWDNSPYPTTLNDNFAILKLMILSGKDNKDQINETLDRFLLLNMQDFCREQGWLRKAGEVDINWASQKQRLTLFQAISPAILSTGKEVLEEWVQFPIIQHYLAWSKVDYQIKNFGKKFYDDWVELDGRHRARYTQILATGRLSSSKPNVLNIPRRVDVYRKAVVPTPGRVFINADFDGQELFITATLSQEPEWLKALANGWDIHSRNSMLIYGKEWEDAAEPGCEFYARDDNGNFKYQKCSCSKHIEMRDNSKQLSFGLLYGISKYSLAFDLKISVDEAAWLMERFFTMLPNIKKMMDNFGRFAIDNGFIVEPVLGRVRYFDRWKLSVPEEHGGIIRQAYNFPSQGAGGALLKISIALLRRKLNHLNLNDHMMIINPYHDELSMESDPEYAEQGKVLLENAMMDAAKYGGFPGLKASAAIGDSWYDCH